MADADEGRRALRFVVTGALLLSPMAVGCGGEEDMVNEPAPETINEPPEEHETVNEPAPEPEPDIAPQPTVNEPAPEPSEETAPEQ